MNTVLPPCPFCGGDAIERVNKTPVRDISPNSWTPGSVTGVIVCVKCGAKSQECVIDCGTGDPKDTDVERALSGARAYWCARMGFGIHGDF